MTYLFANAQGELITDSEDKRHVQPSGISGFVSCEQRKHLSSLRAHTTTLITITSLLV